MVRRYSPLLLLFVIYSYGIAVVAAPGTSEEEFGRPTLLVLSYPDADKDEDEDEEGRRVRAMVSIVTLEQPLPARSTWRILPGTVYPAQQRPRGEVKVKLYTDEGANKR
ncbi:MAG: hypothetical protein ACC641_07725, partial [Acidiferrobacterales bacterium]